MKVLFIADEVSGFKPKGDTSLSIAQSFFAHGLEVYFCKRENLNWVNTDLVVDAKKISKIEKFKLPKLSRSERFSIEDFQFVMVRKDPPFDQSYVKLCWLLQPFQTKVRILNRPDLLLRHHEKMLPVEAVKTGFLTESDLIPSTMVSSFDGALEFAKKIPSEKIILKPYFGFAGSDVFLLDKKKFSAQAKKYFKKTSLWILQPFVDGVKTDGDARILFVHGKFVGGFARIPKKGGFVSNLAQGGSAAAREFSSREMTLIEKIEKWTKHLQLDLVGADLISGKLNEMNITSPTGFPTYEILTGKSLADLLVEGLLK